MDMIIEEQGLLNMITVEKCFNECDDAKYQKNDFFFIKNKYFKIQNKNLIPKVWFLKHTLATKV